VSLMFFHPYPVPPWSNRSWYSSRACPYCGDYRSWCYSCKAGI